MKFLHTYTRYTIWFLICAFLSTTRGHVAQREAGNIRFGNNTSTTQRLSGTAPTSGTTSRSFAMNTTASRSVTSGGSKTNKNTASLTPSSSAGTSEEVSSLSPSGESGVTSHVHSSTSLTTSASSQKSNVAESNSTANVRSTTNTRSTAGATSSTTATSIPGPVIVYQTIVGSNGQTSVIEALGGPLFSSLVDLATVAPTEVIISIPTGVAAAQTASSVSGLVIGLFPILSSWEAAPVPAVATAVSNQLLGIIPSLGKVLEPLGSTPSLGSCNSAKRRRELQVPIERRNIFTDVANALTKLVSQVVCDVVSAAQTVGRTVTNMAQGELDNLIHEVEGTISNMKSVVDDLVKEIDQINEEQDEDQQSSQRDKATTSASQAQSSTSSTASCTKPATASDCLVQCASVTQNGAPPSASCSTTCSSAVTGCSVTGITSTTTSCIAISTDEIFTIGLDKRVQRRATSINDSFCFEADAITFVPTSWETTIAEMTLDAVLASEMGFSVMRTVADADLPVATGDMSSTYSPRNSSTAVSPLSSQSTSRTATITPLRPPSSSASSSTTSAGPTGFVCTPETAKYCAPAVICHVPYHNGCEDGKCVCIAPPPQNCTSDNADEKCPGLSCALGSQPSCVDGKCQCEATQPSTLATTSKKQEPSTTSPPLSPTPSQAVYVQFDFIAGGGDAPEFVGQWVLFAVDLRGGDFVPCDRSYAGTLTNDRVRLDSVPPPPDIRASEDIFGNQNCHYLGNGDGSKTFGQFTCDGIPVFDCIRDGKSDRQVPCYENFSVDTFVAKVQCIFPAS